MRPTGILKKRRVEKVKSGWHKTLQRFSRSPMAVIGSAILFSFIIITLFSSLIVPFSPTKMNLSSILSPPSNTHWFGADEFGRDIFSRILAGTKISLTVSAWVLILTVLLGVTFGLISGYYRTLDNLIMRFLDVIMAFPAILIALAVMAIIGPRTENVILALTIVYAPRMARLVRATVLSLKELDFVEAARAMGASDYRIIIRHILPGCLAPVLVQGTFIFGYAILGEASLSFLGLGVPPPAPSLGNILSDARPMLREAPWIAMYPSIAIALLILSLNLLGDGLRDVFNPRGVR